MNKYLILEIDNDKLRKDLDDILDESFISSITVDTNGIDDNKVWLYVEAKYSREYAEVDREDILINIELFLDKAEMLQQEDLLSYTQHCLMTEYNKRIADILLEELENAKREYKNFRA